MRDGGEILENTVLAEARPYLASAIDRLTAFYNPKEKPEEGPFTLTDAERLAGLKKVPSADKLLTPEGYDFFWKTCDNIYIRAQIYRAVMQTHLPTLEGFGPPSPPRGVWPAPARPRQFAIA